MRYDVPEVLGSIVHKHHCDIQLGTADVHFLPGQGRLSLLPTLDEKNEYRRYGRVQMTMGECLAHSSLPADSKVTLAIWPQSWLPPGADRYLFKLPD